MHSTQLEAIWREERLPDPQAQADLLILLLGDSLVPSGQFVALTPIDLMALIGTADDPRTGKQSGINFVINHLKSSGFIEEPIHPPADGNRHIRLTFAGWARLRDLQSARVDSRLAFMAMGFANPAVAEAFETCFRPAVAATGFELRRLDSKPKAGLIDYRMRVEIRSAKFLVADLTDENRGAYWEAGFAEGANRPVFYTCEATKFDAAKTHFDTEHMFTVKWTRETLSTSAEELKAAIRNTFPVDAKQED